MKFIRPFLSGHKLKTALFIFTSIFIGFFIPLSITFLYLDHKYPLALPDKNEDFAITVAAFDKTPLRSFPDKKGVWRYPVKITEVSPLYIEALIHYEDRWFFHHPGINPWALLRAVFQYAKYRRAISGGSTLTMQVARILHPHAKTIPGKSIQMFRALQLEYHLTKNEILTLYLNYAPFGGTIEGVQTASFAYLGKPAMELSRAEAALLAVLPQTPSRLRPDRHGMRARKARDKVLNRMAKLKVWSEEVVEDAKMETVDCTFNQRSVLAPLLARRLKINMKASKNRSGVIRTLIDINRQQTVANIIRDFIHTTPKRTSAAALLVENKTLAVKAYVGSGDFFDNERFGHVDMIRAYRSPGSTLKPFLYAFAIEEGLIHSESLLVDAPFSFSGYRPGNFTRNFSGPVSVSEALRRSLNIPAVDLLDRIGPMFFDSRLRQGGFKLKFAPHVKPNLSMILGGVGTNLEDLVSAFAAFGRNGLSGKLRYTPETSISERRMMDPGAAYIIRRILKDMHRPDLPGGRLSLDRSRQVAWKTGTSYGARDAWTIGVTDDYTIGIWVGRPDGTPSPGQYGRATAAPLLFAIVDSLPRQYRKPSPIPDNVDLVQICWPLGTAPFSNNDALCHHRRKAWILDSVIPPTLPDRMDKFWQKNPVQILVNPATGLRIDFDCPAKNPVIKKIARWPKAAFPWLKPYLRAASRIPKLDPGCKRPVSHEQEGIKIMGLESHTILRPPGSQTKLPEISLSAQGGKGSLYWLLDDVLIAWTKIGTTHNYRFNRPGSFRLTVMDMAGDYDAVDIVVLGG